MAMPTCFCVRLMGDEDVIDYDDYNEDDDEDNRTTTMAMTIKTTTTKQQSTLGNN